MLISIAIPCYRSEKTIRFVVEEIKQEFLLHPEHSYNIILVNDGSPDNTLGVIKQLSEENGNITGVDLSRNFGQNAAKMAALPYVKGDVLVYMDDDGQHPASGIFVLLDKLLEGYDMVYAQFSHKKHNAFKRFTSAIKNRVAIFMGNKPKGIALSSFYIMDKVLIKALQKYESPFPASGSFTMQITSSIANAPVLHRARREGKSNYSFKRLWRLWLTSVTNFTIVPLRIASILGMICAVIGFGVGTVMVIRKIINPSIQAGYTSMIATLLFIGGLIMIMLGTLGEYIGRMFMTISGKPQYIVRRVYGEEQNTDKD